MNIDSQSAWAAGLFEGEGWFTFGRNNRQAGYRFPSAGLATSDRDVLLRFAEIVGCGHLTEFDQRVAGLKHMYQWKATSKADLQKFIALVLPWLGERRRARALEVLDLIEGRRSYRPRQAA